MVLGKGAAARSGIFRHKPGTKGLENLTVSEHCRAGRIPRMLQPGKTMKLFSHPSRSPWKSLKRIPHFHRHNYDEDEFNPQKLAG